MIELKFTFEATDELVELVNRLASGTAPAPAAPAATAKRPAAKKKPAAETEPEPRVITFADPEPEEPKKDPEPEEPKKDPEPEPKSAPSTQDIRNAMAAVRDKLEYGTPAPGESKGPNAEADETIHKELTKTFKAIAHSIGQCKPSELPEEKRQEFIDSINQLQVNADNTITPF